MARGPLPNGSACPPMTAAMTQSTEVILTEAKDAVAQKPAPAPQKAPPPWRQQPGRVLVILPAFNEADNLSAVLASVDQALYEAGIEFEVIVVDDGSTDDTARIAREHARYMPLHVEVHDRNQGLGAAIRDGLRVAVERARERDIVVVMDSDNSHTPGLILNMVRRAQEGADVVIASRYRDGAIVRGVPMHRILLSWAARIVMQTLFPTAGVRDYTCGYRAYKSALLKRAFDRYGEGFVNQEGFQCMVDILLKLRKMGVVFREVPLMLRYDLKGGVSKMRIARTIAQTMKLLVRRRFSS